MVAVAFWLERNRFRIRNTGQIRDVTALAGPADEMIDGFGKNDVLLGSGWGSSVLSRKSIEQPCARGARPVESPRKQTDAWHARWPS